MVSRAYKTMYKAYNFYTPPEPYEDECWSELSKTPDFKKLLDARTAAGWRPTGLARVLTSYLTVMPPAKCPYPGCLALPKGKTCFQCRCNKLCLKFPGKKPTVSPDGSCHCVSNAATLANIQKEISRRVDACQQEKLKSGTGKEPCDSHTVYVGGHCIEDFGFLKGTGIEQVSGLLSGPNVPWLIAGGLGVVVLVMLLGGKKGR